MFKWILFQSHWLLGLTAGIVLAVVGVTGGMLSFEDEILRALNPGVMTVEARGTAPLRPAELMALMARAEPEKRVQALTVYADPARAARVSFAAAGRGPRGETRYVDPYDGRLLGQPRGEEFLRTTMQIHRWLAAGDVGKHIVGASTIALIVLSLSGLYLRWPRRIADWRSWFRIDFNHKGRSFLWALHSVIGTWVLIPYVVMSLTGLYWSYEWYRNGLFELTGTPRPANFGPPGGGQPQQQAQQGQGGQRGGQGGGQGGGQRAGGGEAQAPDIAALWTKFLAETGGYSQATLRLPAGPGQPVQFTYQIPDPPHERANNTLALDARTGEVRNHRQYAALPPGQKFMASIFVLHSGGFFGLGGLVLFMLASLLMPLFAITGWMLYLDRRAKKRAALKLARDIKAAPAAGGGQVLVAFASQTGAAERVAWRSAQMLQAAGIPVAVEPLAQVDAARLARAERALFVVSTFGDGEPPDGARAFQRRIMADGPEARLANLRYGLLALGDSQYDRFCGFGHSLDHWLRGQGAAPLFDLVEVDRSDEGALRHWQHHLGVIGGKADLPDWTAPAYGRWRLAERRLLNPGSVGGPCYHLSLEPMEAGLAGWAAGDIAEIGPRHAPDVVEAFLAEAGLDAAAPVTKGGRALRLGDVVAGSLLPLPEDLSGLAPQAAADRLAPLPSREYSIASLTADGRIDLLVRQAVREDGTLGLGSGWLTAHAAPGAEIDLRVRENPSFHAPAGDRPLILIGNGTGLAGLRAHLKLRAAAGGKRNWLVFGERQAAHDFHHRAEIEAWVADGTITRLDLAFSRDQAERLYVQHRLMAAAEALRAWVADGAAIYVCGSLAGMAPDVETTLIDILGPDGLERLADEGRYRRDVY
jgi:sulfite reductase (NADPH) flavoprotein alpha-component